MGLNLSLSPKIHFLTFGGGDTWPLASQRILSQAKETGLFDTLSAETGDEIFVRYPEFKANKAFITQNPRGWGYWLWKPFLLKSYMQKIQGGDLLFYLDAGFEIIPSNKHLLEKILIKAIENTAMIFSYSEYPILNMLFWTKQDLINKALDDYNIDPNSLLRLPLISAGSVAFVKNQKNIDLIADWYRISSMNGGRFIDDTPSISPQKHLFFEHRHDQSVLSLLVAAYNLPIVGPALDYDYREEYVNKWPELMSKPFLAMRNKSNLSCLNKRRNIEILLKKAIRIITAQPLYGGTHIVAENLSKDHQQALKLLNLI